jgi:hypothetical protein
MFRQLLMVLLLSITVIGGSASVQSTKPARTASCAQDHAAWLADVLKEMQAIEPGMTRKDLLKVFGTEGGLSSRLHRTFVSQDCPYCKVDIEFEPMVRRNGSDDGSVASVEDSGDVIVRVSKPYLQFSNAD